jgi:hypothetical protein
MNNGTFYKKTNKLKDDKDIDDIIVKRRSPYMYNRKSIVTPVVLEKRTVQSKVKKEIDQMLEPFVIEEVKNIDKPEVEIVNKKVIALEKQLATMKNV